MSRKNIAGETYDLAFGVDHATGPFVQIFLHPQSEQECAVVVVDNNGVDIREEAREFYDEFPVGVRTYLAELAASYSRNPLGHIGEEHVIEIAKLLGDFPDITSEVYEIFD